MKHQYLFLHTGWNSMCCTEEFKIVFPVQHMSGTEFNTSCLFEDIFKIEFDD